MIRPTLLFLLFLSFFFASCRKDIYNINEREIPKHEPTTIQKLMKIPEVRFLLKSIENVETFTSFSNKSSELVILKMTSGFLEFEHSKVVISLNGDKHSILVLSYDYDKSSYKDGDFRTYTGKINIYNAIVEQMTAFEYFKGRIVRAKNESNPYKAWGYWVEPEPGYTDWCLVLPDLCNYWDDGGGSRAEEVINEIACPDEGGGGGAGSNIPSNDPTNPPFVWSFHNGDDVTLPIDRYPADKPSFQFLKSDNYESKYPRFTDLVKNLKSFVMSNRKVLSALKKWSGFSEETVLEYLSFGKGPIIKVVPMTGAFGYFNGKENPAVLNIRDSYVDALEFAPFSFTRESLAFLLSVTVLHEFIHFGTHLNGVSEGAYDFGNVFEKEAFNIIVNTDNLNRVYINFAKYF